jgi:integrase/recombinase XerC
MAELDRLRPDRHYLLPARQRKLSPHTLDNYARDLQELRALLAPAGDAAASTEPRLRA